MESYVRKQSYNYQNLFPLFVITTLLTHMKHILFSLCFLVCAAWTSSAQNVSGSFHVITEQDCVNLVVDFSEATIMGMSEEQFRLYEEDWIKDQPDIYARIRDAINEKLKGKLAVGEQKEAQYTLLVKVISISKRGEFLTNLYLIQNKEEGEQEQIGIVEEMKTKNKTGSAGTKLRSIKLQAGILGDRIGYLLLKEYKKK